MAEEDEVRKPKGHEIGMPIDSMSVAELETRIELLQAEIGRLRQAIAARQQTRAEADAIFKR